MKNNFIIFFFICFFLNETSQAEQFKFETSLFEIKDGGNLIFARDGKAISFDKNIEIDAKSFEYNKKTNFLKALDGIALINSESLRIKFGEIEIDKKNYTILAKKNVKIIQLNKDFKIETEQITYNRKNSIINSNTNSILIDKFNNKIITEKFNYNLNKNILKIEKANLIDSKNNKLFTELAFMNTRSNKLFGKDVAIDFNNKTFGKENEPRLKGKSIVHENLITKITKGVFTTCKRREKCPPWQLSAETIEHDKKKQVIRYNNAFLKVYDVPVMYFPKFFHPDPTVDRKSGFLIPTLKNSSGSKSFLSVPYFIAISQNKDATVTPRFYNDDKLLVQTEFRQANFNSNHSSDFAILKEKNESSKSHFYYSYNKMMNLTNFEESFLDFKIEKTSNDTYLKKNKIKSPLVKGYEVLESSVGLSLYDEDLSIDTNLIVYENLNKKSNSDKYEFILPRIKLIKNIENKTNLNGSFLFKSNNFIRNYETNIFEKVNINDLIFNSNPIISNSGFYNTYDFIVKNVNTDTQKSDNYKKGENYYLSGLLQFNSSLPLIKDNGKYQNIFKPKFSLKISPENTKDISSEVHRMDVNNIFSLNRLSIDDTVEGGLSLTYGSDFVITENDTSNEFFSFKIANNLRFKDNEDLPRGNQIGSKTSNFFSEINFSPNEIIKTKYNASTKNNLTDINYESFIAEISLNNFVTSFDYVNENDTLKKNSYLLNTTKFSFDKSNSLILSTRENKTSDLTEYYNFMYQYKNDCLAASIEYNKDYYDDRDIKPEENIFLKLTIIPFGETSSPNLKD